MNTVTSLPAKLQAMLDDVDAVKLRPEGFVQGVRSLLALASPAPSAGVGVEALHKLADAMDADSLDDTNHTNWRNACDRYGSELRRILSQHPAAPSVSPAVEGASSAGEAVAFLLECRKPGLGQTTYRCWGREELARAKHLAHTDGYTDDQLTVRELAYTTPPPAPAAEQDKAARDALIYGSGYMVGGKHVPVEQVSITLPPKPEARGVEGTREAFERWVSQRHGAPSIRWADSGKYQDRRTDAWWECWQTALATPNPVRAEQPEGKWKLVPVEATDAMVLAAVEKADAPRAYVRPIYTAMLATAPAAPVGVDGMVSLAAIKEAMQPLTDGRSTHNVHTRQVARDILQRIAALAGKERAK